MADAFVRSTIIAESRNLPNDLRHAHSPYIWAIAVKKLLIKGSLVLHMKLPENGNTPLDPLIAAEQLDLAIAHHYLREKFAISIESFISKLLFQILPKNGLVLVLQESVAESH